MRCAECGGRGQVTSGGMIFKTCSICGGSGKLYRDDSVDEPVIKYKRKRRVQKELNNGSSESECME